MLIVARFAGKFGLQQVNFLLSDNKKLVTLLQRQRASPVISKGIGLHDQCYISSMLSKAPFVSLKKQAKTMFWLICCERKILFQLKKTS